MAHILIVDDEEVLRDLLVQILETMEPHLRPGGERP